MTVGFTLVGSCDGVGPCRLTALSGNWGWSLRGGSTCLTPMLTAYQAAQDLVTATFTPGADGALGVQAFVPQSAVPVTAVITDARATRVGSAPVEPVGCS